MAISGYRRGLRLSVSSRLVPIRSPSEWSWARSPSNARGFRGMGRLVGISWGRARRGRRWLACVAGLAVMGPLWGSHRSKPSIAVDPVPHLLGVKTPTGTRATSLYATTMISGARRMWARGYTGAGVDVAVIDSGIASVEGLAAGKVVNGPDFSGGATGADTDGFGHGTHMAGIIAANAPDLLGMAPDARLVNVKVADAAGNTDVETLIAAIDWVVDHKDSNGLHIRVLNLSFGVQSTSDYVNDPLAFAAERAWKAGIVVVAAAGNDGPGINVASLTNPA